MILKKKIFEFSDMFIKSQHEKNSGIQETDQISEVEEVNRIETVDVKSIVVDIAGLNVEDDYVSLEVNLDEESQLNKRAASQIRITTQKR
ncbi:hypothetical protein ACJ72_06818 [Emergomyces africanus]|uniref:Uncharacterized protein n=1 Tax=Emergomyces africanus TaxID=1955775 RepID=A0A1B7NQ01_9EURO|nr:hypothetical protein ACJ72_06818 [Emergomyces africanus]